MACIPLLLIAAHVFEIQSLIVSKQWTAEKQYTFTCDLAVLILVQSRNVGGWRLESRDASRCTEWNLESGSC